MKDELIATVLIEKPVSEVWSHWINPESIKKWNIPFENWHCPNVKNDVRKGGLFDFRMENAETRDGFDYKGSYDCVMPMNLIESTCEDGRKNKVEFQDFNGVTIICETFEPDAHTPIETQQKFTNAILLNFKNFMEHR